MSGVSGLLGPIGTVVGNLVVPGVGGAIGGAIGTAVGGMTSGGSGSTGNLNQDAYNLELAKWNRYNQIYAPIQDSLSKYYNSLTPEDLASRDLTAHAQTFNANSDLIKQKLAQRGLTGSGIDLGLQNANNLQLARDNATTIANAPQQVANAKMNFINAGIVDKGNTAGTAANSQLVTDNNNKAFGDLISQVGNSGALSNIGSGISDFLWNNFASV